MKYGPGAQSTAYWIWLEEPVFPEMEKHFLANEVHKVIRWEISHFEARCLKMRADYSFNSRTVHYISNNMVPGYPSQSTRTHLYFKTRNLKAVNWLTDNGKKSKSISNLIMSIIHHLLCSFFKVRVIQHKLEREHPVNKVPGLLVIAKSPQLSCMEIECSIQYSWCSLSPWHLLTP